MISFFSRLLNLIAPPICPVCGSRLSANEQLLCGKCNLHLPRTYYSKIPYDNELAKLFWVLLPIERATAFFYYEAHSEVSRLIYQLKYRHHPETGRILGRMVAREIIGDGFFEGIDMIIPVPLAKKRLRERGYNQSMEIARGVSEITGLPIADHVVRRKKFVESQTKKDRWQRKENVKDMFSLEDPIAIHDKHVLLIDDVVTTGATIIACGEELKKAEGIRISVLSLGFVKGNN